MTDKVIVHLDMDAFFAAIEQRDNPRLRGKPVVVGADPQGGRGRGVVSTCSYEARPFGVRSAMPISTAYKLCPHAIFLPVNGTKYQEASRQIFQVLENFTPDIEPISIDEAFLDITGSYHFYKTPYDTCLKIKEEIKKKVNLTASIGIAPIKMAAKIASDLSKPDGLLEIKPDKLFEFLWPLPIERLWGVGAKTKALLNTMGMKTIGDIARADLQILDDKLGEHGRHLYRLATAIDPRKVEDTGEIKSVSHEHTFDTDTSDRQEVENILLSLSEKVSRRLRQYELKGRTLTVKIRLTGFKTYTRAHTFAERTNFTDDIYKTARILLEEFFKNRQCFRLIGVRLSSFEDAYVQESLFRDKQDEKKEGIHRAIDLIKDKFGEKAIRRGQ